MAGGVMQLVAVGAQDQFITGSPEISYFKMVYKRHTNFSMESIRQVFNTKPVLESSRNVFTCRVNRVADLMQEVYLSFQLPDIYSSDKFRFRWIENVSQYIIYSCSVRIDTQLIDQLWGEWMDIWNELTLSTDKKNAYDKMSGNVEDFYSPKLLNPYVVIDNNNITYTYYPVGSTLGSPSIKGRRFFIPLQFWFTKNPGLALPLVALQYQNVDITLELRAASELYQIFDIESGLYISPEEYRSRHLNLNIGKFNEDEDINGVPNHDVSLQRFMVPVNADYSYLSTSVDIDAYLECNFIFLDEPERKAMAANTHDYLVERVYRLDREGVGRQETIDLVLQNPVKEIIWITRRGDAQKYNSWNNFTNSLLKLPNYNILSTAKFLWNGMERIEDKTAEYFNYIQPFQHHTRSPRDGIYSYSFALYPEKIQPSGTFNASTINKIQMYVTTTTPTENYDYEFVIYSLYYNIFRVMSGSGGMVFAN